METSLATTRPEAIARSAPHLPYPIQAFLVVSLLLTAVCLFAERWSSLILHLGYPYNWPLMPNFDSFRDFYLYEERFRFFHSRLFFTYPRDPYLYPAPPALFYRFFFLFPHSTEVFLGTLSAAAVTCLWLLGRALLARGVLLRDVLILLTVTASCSYPFFFEFEQANVEWIGCLLVGVGIWAFVRDRGYAAALCFGLAGSMKLYPLFFLGLLLARKQYRQIAVAIAVFAATTLASLWMLCPDLGFAWRGINAGLQIFRQFYVLGYHQLRFDHSLFGAFKALSLIVSKHPLTPELLSVLLGIYMSVAAFAGILLYFDRIRKLPVANQVLCLSIATILLPPISYDYTLLQLYAPWALLLLVALEHPKHNLPGLTAALACLAILLAPESEFILHGEAYGGQIKAITLVLLAAIALRRSFPSSFDTPYLVHSMET